MVETLAQLEREGLPSDKQLKQLKKIGATDGGWRIFADFSRWILAIFHDGYVMGMSIRCLVPGLVNVYLTNCGKIHDVGKFTN